jgi:hypothetical protein
LVEDLGYLLFDPHELTVTKINMTPPVIKELLREKIGSLEKEGVIYNRQDQTKVDFGRLLQDTATSE